MHLIELESHNCDNSITKIVIMKTVFFRSLRFFFRTFRTIRFFFRTGRYREPARFRFCPVITITERSHAALAWHGGHWPCDWNRGATIQYRSEQRSFQSVINGGRAHAQILGRAGKKIATLGTGSAWPSKINFNLIDRAKLLLYVMLAIIDGFVERIDNAHWVNTIQSSWVLWGRSSLCFLQKVRIWDSVSTDIEVNASLPGRKYIFVTTLQQQSPLFCWTLSFWTLQQWFFYFLQK